MLTYAASLNSFAVFWSLRLEVPSYSLPSYVVTMCGVDMTLASLVLHHPLAWSASFLLCLLHIRDWSFTYDLIPPGWLSYVSGMTFAKFPVRGQESQHCDYRVTVQSGPALSCTVSRLMVLTSVYGYKSID